MSSAPCIWAHHGAAHARVRIGAKEGHTAEARTCLHWCHGSSAYVPGAKDARVRTGSKGARVRMGAKQGRMRVLSSLLRADEIPSKSTQCECCHQSGRAQQKAGL